MIIIYSYSYSYYNYYYLFQTEDRLAHALTGKLSAAPPLSLAVSESNCLFPQPRLELQRWKRRPEPRVTVAYCLALSLAGMKRFDAKQQYIGDGWTSGSVRSPNHSLHVLPFESRPQILSDRVGLSSEKRCWLGNFPPKRNIFKAKVPLCLPEPPKRCAKTYSRLIESFSVAFNNKKKKNLPPCNSFGFSNVDNGLFFWEE